MLNLKCNQKSKFKEDLKCARYQKEMDNEKHIIEQCEAIQINRPDNIKHEDAFNSETDVDQLKIIAQFVIEVLNCEIVCTSQDFALCPFANEPNRLYRRRRSRIQLNPKQKISLP